MAEIMIHDFLLGFIKILILHHAEKSPVYGKEFHQKLVDAGFEVSYGTIYPFFPAFEEKGYLVCEGKKIKGKIRKYYSLTEPGKIALDEARVKAKMLFETLYEK